MTALAESQRSRRPLHEGLAVEPASREGRWAAAVARIATGSATTVAFVASILSAHLAVAQAPPSPGQPWSIPESAISRAAALGDAGFSVPQKQYDLAALVDLAERENPKTREAWEVAREAAAGIGLAESAYLPQLSLQAIGGVAHTPRPLAQKPVSACYFGFETP